MNNPSPQLQTLLTAIKIAGAAILELQKIGFTIERKANNDIVTKADLLANDILKTELMSAYPDYGWLSEESVDDAQRLTCHRTWIVDPIDGTLEFARGIPEYAISVALIEKGKPLLGAVFNPATNELFYAERGRGTWLWDMHLSCKNDLSSKLVLLASRSEYKIGKWQGYLSHDVQPIGSIAYKLALISAGKGHATFSLGPKNEWDIAAGVLLVEEAGGIATDKCDKTFIFNQKKSLVDGIVASSSNSRQVVFDLINSVQNNFA